MTQWEPSNLQLNGVTLRFHTGFFLPSTAKRQAD